MSIAAISAHTPTLSRILSPRELGELTGLAPATIWRMRRRGELPEPIRLSPHRVGWREDTIADWLAKRTDTTSGQTTPAGSNGRSATSR